MKDKTVVVVSDLHCGHVAGLTPPEWHKSMKRFPGLRALHHETWKWAVEYAKKYKGADLLICNGDAIDGKGLKTGSTEELTTNRHEQAEMAYEYLRLYEAKKYILTYGTGYHVGAEEDFEVRIVDLLKKEMGVDAEIHNHAQVEINGCILDLKHHIASSSTPYSRGTAISKERLWNLLWAEGNACAKANLIIRSHTHFCFEVSEPGASWRALYTPAMQAPSHNKYGGRRCSGTVDWGMVAIKINKKGEPTCEYNIKRLQTAKAELIHI